MATATDEPDVQELRLLHSPHTPEPPQHAYLLLDELGIREALYGGAAGGGKSDTLLMGALRYVDVPGYAAILFRRTFMDLALPGALMDRAKAWLLGRPGVKWNEQTYRFTFETGGTPATLSFGYLQHSLDKYRYQSAEFQFVGFDEATQFDEADYRYLFSRLRGPDVDEAALATLSARERSERELLARVPLRMRAASNPGGRGHAWVLRRLVERVPAELDGDQPPDPYDTPEHCARRVFIKAKLDDNPHVNREAYRANLRQLPAVERARLEDGNWYADDGTLYFSGNGIAAAVALGEELDAMAAEGVAPPPKGGLLALGLDWGDHTAFVYGWPLEAGGLWVVAGDELVGREPTEATNRILAELGVVPAWEGLETVPEPLELLSDVRYDAAGLMSQKTFNARARERRPDLKATKVNFNAYKRPTGLYLRLLLERAAQGKRTRILAISPRCRRLIAQMRGLVKDAKDAELWEKQDDHCPDALIALAAPIAKANRGRVGTGR